MRKDSIEYQIWDVLADVANTLHSSKYADSYTLKGGFALMSVLHTSQRNEFFRVTTDIDLDYRSVEKWEGFVKECQTLLTDNSVYGFKYELKARRALDAASSDSLTFNAFHGDQVFRFKIDMNIKISDNTALYNLPGLNTVIKTGSLEYMLTDKLNVLGQKKACRRIKDLYDVYVISHLKGFTLREITEEWEKNESCRTENIEPVFILDINSINMLRHAYEKFVGIYNKPDFETAYCAVVGFSAEIYEAIFYNVQDKTWDTEKRIWK